MKISFLMLTLNRYELTKQCFEENIRNAQSGLNHNITFEHLIADNGSNDKRVVEWGQGVAKYHRANSINEGVSKAFNQLYLRSMGDYIVLLGNDLVNDPGWLNQCITYCNQMPNAGIVGVQWETSHTPALSWKNGVESHHLDAQKNRVFGTWLIKRRVIEEIGLFHEGFSEYGLEDSDMNERVNLAGFNSFYVPNIRADHKGVGEHDTGEYREMKNKSMSINAGIFGERCANFQIKGIKEPLPSIKDAI